VFLVENAPSSNSRIRGWKLMSQTCRTLLYVVMYDGKSSASSSPFVTPLERHKLFVGRRANTITPDSSLP
jgi:hypothetical protein